MCVCRDLRSALVLEGLPCEALHTMTCLWCGEHASLLAVVDCIRLFL